eukprot:CFRG2172T1
MFCSTRFLIVAAALTLVVVSCVSAQDEEFDVFDDGLSMGSAIPKKPVETGFFHAFVASTSVIVVSELGDKTFFIAAILAMKHSRLIVWSGAISALGLMTVLSAGMGWVITIIPRVYTFYASTVLFFVFGIKLIREGSRMTPEEEAEELDEVTQELKKQDEERDAVRREDDPEALGTAGEEQSARWQSDIANGILMQSFTMTFLAEWGDRSQITTVVLAARENPFGVAIGGTIGHAVCTSLAVVGGRMLAQRISVKTVTIAGGIVFLIFAVLSVAQGPDA